MLDARAPSPRFRTVSVPFGGGTLPVHVFERPGEGTPVLYLHGLGSSLRDFLPAADPTGLPGNRLLALDFPGCGSTPHPPHSEPTLIDLAGILFEVLDRTCREPVVLVGHSMGGLVALLAARRDPRRFRAFVNVEGNLAPEDCFLSRKGAEWPADGFADRLQAWLRDSGRSGFLTYAERFGDEVSDEMFRHYSRWIVHHSDGDPLLAWFTALEMPRLFVHGEETPAPGYLADLRAAGVQVAAAPGSHHFPLYSDPAAFLRILRTFVDGLRPPRRPSRHPSRPSSRPSSP